VSLDPAALHGLRGGGEFGFPERLLTGNQEHDVIGHQVQDGRQVAGRARGQPPVDEHTNRPFIVEHMLPP